MKIKTANTILYCRRWKECVEFYSKDLNLTVLYVRDWFVEFRLTDSTRLSIADEARASIKSSGGTGRTISMEVDNIQAAYRNLKARGLELTDIKVLWGSQVFYLYDPEGTRLEFWS